MPGYLTSRTSGFLSTITSSVDKITSAAKGLICTAKSVYDALKNPSLTAGQLGSLVSGIALSVAGAVVGLIETRVNSILNTILNPLRQIEDLINEVGDTLQLLFRAYKSVEKEIDDFADFLEDRQACASSGANILNCIAQVVAANITKKIAMSANKQFDKLESSITKEVMKTDGVIDNYVERNTRFIEKATNQIKFLQ